MRKRSPRDRGALVMLKFDVLAGSWPALTDRLDRTGALQRWALTEPALAGIGGCLELPDLIRNRTGGRGDEVFAALVRTAARDGGDDPDAVLLILHLLRRGINGLADRFPGRGPDVLALVIGELAVQLRAYPWRTRRPYPARLLLDAKHALWRGELRPIINGCRPHEAILVDPARWPDTPVPPEAAEDVDVIEVLRWAAATGVASVEDLRLLLALEHHRGYGARAGARVAAAWGVNQRTVRRRRDRTLRKLRQAAGAYLAEAA